MEVPVHRKLWRGMGGRVLAKEKFFEVDKRNTRGAVDLAFLSTTKERNVAIDYSGKDKKLGTLLEIDYGKVDCPAPLDELSQYPGEKEMLFGPLSNLEVVGDPRLDQYNGQKVLVVPIRINSNLKAQTI